MHLASELGRQTKTKNKKTKMEPTSVVGSEHTYYIMQVHFDATSRVSPGVFAEVRKYFVAQMLARGWSVSVEDAMTFHNHEPCGVSAMFKRMDTLFAEIIMSIKRLFPYSFCSLCFSFTAKYVFRPANCFSNVSYVFCPAQRRSSRLYHAAHLKAHL